MKTDAYIASFLSPWKFPFPHITWFVDFFAYTVKLSCYTMLPYVVWRLLRDLCKYALQSSHIAKVTNTMLHLQQLFIGIVVLCSTNKLWSEFVDSLFGWQYLCVSLRIWFREELEIVARKYMWYDVKNVKAVDIIFRSGHWSVKKFYISKAHSVCFQTSPLLLQRLQTVFRQNNLLLTWLNL